MFSGFKRNNNVFINSQSPTVVEYWVHILLLSLCVSICTCLCGWVHIKANAYVCVHGALGLMLSLLLWLAPLLSFAMQFLCEPRQWFGQAGLSVSSQGSSCLFICRDRIMPTQLFTWVLGLKLRSSSLFGKHFIDLSPQLLLCLRLS